MVVLVPGKAEAEKRGVDSEDLPGAQGFIEGRGGVSAESAKATDETEPEEIHPKRRLTGRSAHNRKAQLRTGRLAAPSCLPSSGPFQKDGNFNAFSMEMNSAGMLGFTATPSLTCFRRPYCEKMAKANIIGDLISRQLKEKGALSFERHYHVTDPFIQRLGLEAELQGHAGCVNCLEWNEKGNLLASGSDDQHTIFLPHAEDRILITGAADSKVHVHDLTVKETIHMFGDHKNRVKRIATAPMWPNTFWSAAEDGLIRQYDLRENSKHSEVLIDLTEYCGQLVEAKKSMKQNPAAGVHTFCDRQKPLPDGAAQYYVAEVQNGKTSANGVSNGIHLHSNGFRLSEGRAYVELPPYLEKIKLQANEAFACQQWTQAIQLYSRGVQKAPNNAMLYGNRAAAYMKRKWDGDHYDALRDCLRAISLNPCHLKAHFRLARCLFELKYVAEALECLDDFKGKFPEQAHSSACDALDRDINAALFSKSDNGEDKKGSGPIWLRATGRKDSISEDEMVLRERSYDYKFRYCGHCNTTTDIKEANFFGSNAQYIVSGSDDGSFFIWEKETTNLVRVLQGDESIVNCLQPHPSYCFLATSGIDPVSEVLNGRVVEDMEGASQANQRRMNADPLEVMLMNMGYRITGMTGGGSGGSDDEDSSENQVHCRTS
ncbi:hypothetical protein Chor_001607 [Crotalus horridus]